MNVYQTKAGGRSMCKYYGACGNTENCKRCKAFEKKEAKHED